MFETTKSDVNVEERDENWKSRDEFDFIFKNTFFKLARGDIAWFCNGGNNLVEYLILFTLCVVAVPNLFLHAYPKQK